MPKIDVSDVGGLPSPTDVKSNNILGTRKRYKEINGDVILETRRRQMGVTAVQHRWSHSLSFKVRCFRGWTLGLGNGCRGVSWPRDAADGLQQAVLAASGRHKEVFAGCLSEQVSLFYCDKKHGSTHLDSFITSLVINNNNKKKEKKKFFLLS